MDEVPSGARLLSGVDGGAVFDVGAGLDKLALQIGQAVDRAACVDACRGAWVAGVLDLEPGDALVRLMQGAMPDGEVHGLSEFRWLEELKRWITTDPATRKQDH